MIVIATGEHLNALETRFKNSGLDVDAMILTNQYIPVDASNALAKFMVDGSPDEPLFREFVTSLITRARKGSGRRVRAFGEMVALLWAQGNNVATMHLEHLWNKFCETDAFCLFCAYPKSGFTEDAHVSLQNICSVHSKVLSGSYKSSTEILFKNSA